MCLPVYNYFQWYVCIAHAVEIIQSVRSTTGRTQRALKLLFLLYLLILLIIWSMSNITIQQTHVLYSNISYTKASISPLIKYSWSHKSNSSIIQLHTNLLIVFQQIKPYNWTKKYTRNWNSALMFSIYTLIKDAACNISIIQCSYNAQHQDN